MKMKKTLLMACFVIIASLGITLTGCSNSSSDKNVESTSDKDTESTSDKDAENSSDKYAESPYVGTWAATIAEYEGTEYDAEEFIGVTKFAFNADGTGTFIGDGAEFDIEWEPTVDGLKFTDFGGDAYFTYKDGRLVLADIEAEEGFVTVYFEKTEAAS